MCHVININLKSSETITSFVLNRNETEYAHKLEGHHSADRGTGSREGNPGPSIASCSTGGYCILETGCTHGLRQCSQSNKNVSH